MPGQHRKKTSHKRNVSIVTIESEVKRKINQVFYFFFFNGFFDIKKIFFKKRGQEMIEFKIVGLRERNYYFTYSCLFAYSFIFRTNKWMK